MARVLLEIFCEICPTTADAHHHALATFAHKADVELYGNVFAGLMEMIELDVRVAIM